jgi:hypothetical protein
MEAFADIFSFLAGLPAIAGLILAAATIFLTSDWRLSLTGLLVQYVLVGLALTRFIEPQVAVVKILVGVLVVPILYLTARRVQEAEGPDRDGDGAPRFLGLQVGWRAGPLGLPLRLLALLLAVLALIRFFDDYRALLPMLSDGSPLVPPDIAFVSFWLGGMGMLGLLLSGDPLRVATALLTILAAFDLIYSGVETNLAIVGFFSALILLTGLAFSYLAAVQGLGSELAVSGNETTTEGGET